MGIRMLHRRKAHARVHATATADTQAGSRPAPWKRPRPALAPGAATPRTPGTPGKVLRAVAARRCRPLLTRFPAGTLSAFRAGFAPESVYREDSRLRLWAEAARGHLVAALSVLGRLRGPRTVRSVPLVAATATPLTERPDDSPAR